MIRDTFFDMHRFMNLCRKEMVESWKVNLLRTVMIYGVLTIAFLWNGYLQYSRIAEGTQLTTDPLWRFELNFFLFGIVAWGCVSASFLMERMKTKTSRVAVLMTPATMFEKYISRWLVYTFCFVIVFLIAFKLADWTRVLVYTLSYPDVKGIASLSLLPLIQGAEDYHPTTIECLLAFCAFLFIQSCFVLGSTVWPKNAFIKTFAVCIGIIVVYSLVAGGMAKALFVGNHVEPLVDDDQMAICSTILLALGALFNWTLGYFRFKESEIINRW